MKKNKKTVNKIFMLVFRTILKYSIPILIQKIFDNPDVVNIFNDNYF